jgi:hypothetical protein
MHENVAGKRTEQENPHLRLADLLASLSLVIDLGLGKPMEHFLRARLLAVRFFHSSAR